MGGAVTDYVSNALSAVVGAATAIVPTWMTARSSTRVSRETRSTPSWSEMTTRLDRLEADNDALWRAIGVVVWPAMGVLAWIDAGTPDPISPAVAQLRDGLRIVEELRVRIARPPKE